MYAFQVLSREVQWYIVFDSTFVSVCTKVIKTRIYQLVFTEPITISTTAFCETFHYDIILSFPTHFHI